MAYRAEVSHVKEVHKEALLAKPNVVGVGLGFKERGGSTGEELSIVALVRQKVPRLALSTEALVPKTLDGVLTDVRQVGDLRALQGRTGRHRPAPGGVSVGHFRVTAGTLGCVVRERSGGERLILSNNHVLANSNEAQPGDLVLQPGAIDGGRVESDVIARLKRFQPISFSVEPPTCSIAIGIVRIGNLLAKLIGSSHRLETYRYDAQAVNRVDAAVAAPLNEQDIRDEILDIGVVAGTTPARLGMSVRKSGRTTGFTSGMINVIDTTVTVSYGADRKARFEGQLVSGPMSKPGDSGSLLVAGDSLLAVGLLFAGSDQATIFNPIQDVLDALQVVI